MAAAAGAALALTAVVAAEVGTESRFAAADAATRPPVQPATTAARDTGRGTVVLLHGLGRTHRSMRPLARALEGEGYRVVNLGYPSRHHSVSELSDSMAASLERCCAGDAGPVHFVTHSMGGILVRHHLARHPDPRLGRVVMLSPPNGGSEVVDRLPDPLLALALGPAALELGTDTSSVPLALPQPEFELGVITGRASANPLFSWWIPGPDDGKVSVRSAAIQGADLLVVPFGHTMIMRREPVIRQVAAFLRAGAFDPAVPLDP